MRGLIYLSLLSCLVFAVLTPLPAWAQFQLGPIKDRLAVMESDEAPDPGFDAGVAHPAYEDAHPQVLFDEAHNNLHTSEGRYKPLVDLLTNDGYRVTANRARMTREVLQNYQILVLATPSPTPSGQPVSESSSLALSEDECDAVETWVSEGGSLFLVADPSPWPTSTENLARRLGVVLGNGSVIDTSHADRQLNDPGDIVFTRGDGLVQGHPITDGRGPGEQVRRVVIFAGQSLRGSRGSASFLRLSRDAMKAPTPTMKQLVEALASGKARSSALNQQSQQVTVSTTLAGVANAPVDGDALGLAITRGKGRVIVVGDAQMFSASLVRLPSGGQFALGMSRPHYDNRQLALNIFHWLSGLLK